ncbi:MAG: darcynin family protein [Burkholderiales bacterium]
MARPRTFFMLLAATRHWRELGPAERREVFDATLAIVFDGFPDLRMSHYAAGEFDARCSDVIVWQAGDVAQYHAAIALLRREAFFGAPLFEIVEVIAGVEDDEFEDDAALAW